MAVDISGPEEAVRVEPAPVRLTTAESLVVEVLVAHQLLGIGHTVFPNSLWVRPQLDDLRARGLLAWEFDDDANFVVRPDSALLMSDEARACVRRIHTASLAEHESATTRDLCCPPRSRVPSPRLRPGADGGS
jgi:hypothetical protein